MSTNKYKGVFNLTDVDAQFIVADVASIKEFNTNELTIEDSLTLPFLAPNRIVQTNAVSSLFASNTISNLTLNNAVLNNASHTGTSTYNNLNADEVVVTDNTKKLSSIGYTSDATADTIVLRDSTGGVKVSDISVSSLTPGKLITSDADGFLVVDNTDYIDDTELATTLLSYVQFTDLASYLTWSDVENPPSSTNLGSSSNRFDKFYSGSITDNGYGSYDVEVFASINPSVNNAFSLGSVLSKWRHFYTTNIEDGGSLLTLKNVGNLIPSDDDWYMLGNTEKKWSRLYTKFLTVGNTNVSISAPLFCQEIRATSDSVYNIGDSISRFNQFYSRNISDIETDVIITAPLSCQNIIPSTTTTYDLGSSSKRWNKFYSKNIEDNGSSVSLGSSLLPTSSLTYDLGGSSAKWNQFYSKNISDNGTNVIISGTGLLPSENFSKDLGNPSFRWRTCYTSNFIDTGNELYIFNIDADIVPKINDSIDLGSSSKKFNSLYTKNITDNGTNTTIEGTKIHITKTAISSGPSVGEKIVIYNGSDESAPIGVFHDTTLSNAIFNVYSGRDNSGGSNNVMNGKTFYRAMIVTGAGEVRAGSHTTFSDARAKKDIKDADCFLDKINKIRIVNYNWKHENDCDPENPKVTGVLAQELNEIFPELVTCVDDNYAVNYAGLTPMLVKCIQSLTKRIEILENKISEYNI